MFLISVSYYPLGAEKVNEIKSMLEKLRKEKGII
jgi:hypothetical protein